MFTAYNSLIDRSLCLHRNADSRHKLRMQKICCYVGNAKKPFATFGLSDREYAVIEQRAKRMGITAGNLIVEFLNEWAKEIPKSENAALAQFFTPNAAAVIGRLVRDHGLTKRSIVMTAVDQTMECLEEDVALDGGHDDGEREKMFVADAKRLAAGKKVAWLESLMPPQHKIGCKSFSDTMPAKRARARRQRQLETTGAWTLCGAIESEN